MITVRRDAAIAIGDAREEGVGKLLLELLRGNQPPLALSQDVQGKRGGKLCLDQALVGGGVVEDQKPLMRFFELLRGPGQGQLVVIQAPLNIKVRLVELSAKGHPSCWSTKPCLQ